MDLSNPLHPMNPISPVSPLNPIWDDEPIVSRTQPPEPLSGSEVIGATLTAFTVLGIVLVAVGLVVAFRKK